ncbi:MAG: lamin tail domain-containing protein [Pseudomonadota bacterium]
MNKYQILILLVVFLTHTQAYSASLKIGDLLISEVMSNPSAVSDTNGEWFEIFNASATTHNLNGLLIRDNGSNSHTIDNGTGLFINPGQYLLLGRNNDILSNGGLLIDYQYSNFTLSNSTDQIILLFDANEIASLDYSGAPFGESGVSAEITNQASVTTQVDYRLTQDLQYGNGDFGTPGSAGSFDLTSAANVPVPGAIWLFASATLISLRNVRRAHLNDYTI